MSRLDRTLSRGAKRLALSRFAYAACLTLGVAALAMLVWRVAEKGFLVAAPDWGTAWAIACGSALVLAAAWVWITRSDRASVARLLDDRLGLKATLATAIWARERTDTKDPWNGATIDEGEQAAGRAVLKDAIPVRAPRGWFVPVVLAAITLAGHWLPQQDVMALFADEKEEQLASEEEREREMIQVQAAVEEVRDEIDAALAELDDDRLADLLETQGEQIDPASSPDELRANEMRRLTALRDRLDEMERTGDAAQAEAMRETMNRLNTPPGETSAVTELAQALQQGSPQNAMQALQKLEQQLGEDSALSKEQQQALKEQLERLAEELNKAADQQLQQQMQQIAHQAGLSQQAAMDPEALKEAIENAQNLTEEQKQQLKEQLEQAQGACENCKKAGGAMGQMAQGAGDMKQLMEGLGGQLSQMEMMQQMAEQIGAGQQAIDAMMQQLASQGGMQNLPKKLPQWAQKQKQKQRGGGPGAGQTGEGGDHDGQDNSSLVDLNKQKANTTIAPDAPLIGSMLAEGGTQVRGESVAQFKEAARAGGEAASDAIDERLVPKEYEDVIRQYFGGLEKGAAESDDTPAASDDENE